MKRIEITRFIYSLWLGIKRRPLLFFSEIFLAYSALWTLIESISNFFPETKLKGVLYYLTLVLLSVIFSLVRAYQPRSIQFKVGHADTIVKVCFGDIFEREGYKAIPVNEFFDSEIGLPVSKNSLHGIVIDRFFGGQPAGFDRLVTADLADKPATTVNRKGGKTQRYAIGTTASINTSSYNFLLFALSVTDINTFKASAGLAELIHAIEGLCGKARIVLGGEKLVLPLVGSGLSGIGLPPHHLLQLILLILVNESKKRQFAPNIEVVLHPSRYDDIDLRLVEDFWR